jgi:guanosine-3',5'-bis(diphosphate) 3'-pyrophosphohydrolase
LQVLKRIQKSLLLKKPEPTISHTLEQLVADTRGKADHLVIGDDMQKLDYNLSPCCNPIPGDDVFGFITVGEGIKIHRVNCPNAIQLLSNYAYRVVKAKWNSQHLIAFLAGIKITGTDELGLVNNITKVISTQYNVNMRSISFDTDNGIFEGTIMVYVHSTEHLTQLINKLKKVNGVTNIVRLDS